MDKVDHSNFITVLSEEKPVMIFFHHKADAAQTQKIKIVLKSVEKDLPLLPLYEYIIDQNDENQILAEYIEVIDTPVFIFYKGGNFHRFHIYKPNKFNKKVIMQFIGNKNLYIEKIITETETPINDTVA